MKKEINIVAVLAAMLETTHPGTTWWNDAFLSNLVNQGVEKGWLLRPSVTQVEWTEQGIDETKKTNSVFIVEREHAYLTLSSAVKKAKEIGMSVKPRFPFDAPTNVKLGSFDSRFLVYTIVNQDGNDLFEGVLIDILPLQQ